MKKLIFILLLIFGNLFAQEGYLDYKGTMTNSLTIGSSGSGYDALFWSGTAGDYLQWDASSVVLNVVGTNATTAVNVSDGNVTITDDLTVSGTTTLTTPRLASIYADSAVVIGVDAFTTTAETDTVTIAGALATDIYIVSSKYTAGVDQQDILQWEALAGKLVVHRLASGESALGYTWIRIKVY
uniref:Uncharacterized protein n=1 Tax=viral metagenome TaxID=1070528 RepID=A0A6H1ZP07_9ZZZZ